MKEGLHDRGLSTEIGCGSDCKGNDLSGRKRRHMARLRKLHSRARFRSKKERNLASGFGEVHRITSAVGLGESPREQACSLFRSASDEDLLKGRSIDAFAAASVYAACRCSEPVRTIEEITQVAQVGLTRVRYAYNVINSELGLTALVQRPSDHVARIAGKLDAPDEVERRALEIARTVEDAGAVSGCKPAGVAAACVYQAGQETGWGATQQEIATEATVCAPTLRSNWNRVTDVEEVSA